MVPEGRAAAAGEDQPVGSQAGKHLQHVEAPLIGPKLILRFTGPDVLITR